MIFITDSKQELFADTLPAAKLVHFSQNCAESELVYAYFKMYVRSGNLYIFNYVFEESANAQTLFCLNLNPKQDAFFELTLAPNGALNCSYIDGAKRTDVYTQFARTVNGGDEQGLYRLSEFVIDKKNIKKYFGLELKSGALMSGNAFILPCDGCYGAAFELPPAALPPYPAAFGDFLVVSY